MFYEEAIGMLRSDIPRDLRMSLVGFLRRVGRAYKIVDESNQ